MNPRLRALLARLYRRPEPGDDGAGTPPPPPAAPAAEPAPAPAADTADVDITPAPPPDTAVPPPPPPPEPEPFAALNGLLDQVGKTEPVVPPEPPAADAPPAGTPPPAPGAAPTDPAKPATTPAPPVDPKAIDLTPPEGITPRAADRWTQLVERVKVVPELERRATEAETQLGSVRQLVTSSGLAPDEFQNVLEIGRLYKSNAPADLQKAMTQIDNLRADIAVRLGVDAPGVDVLAGHPDLKAKVEGLSLSREDAIEMVRLRNVGTQHQASTAEQQEMATFNRNVQNAAQQMDAALSQRASTPGHLDKVGFIKQHFSDPARLQAFVTTYQPQQWQSAILMMYDAYTPQVKAAPAPPAVQPLRPTNTAMGSRVPNGQPITAMSSVMAAIESAGL